MSISTLKDKGQITLPAIIRKQLHASKGDIFKFEIVDGKVIMTLQKLVPAKSKSAKAQIKKTGISKYIGSMKGSYGSVNKIDNTIRKERNAWD